MPAEFSRALAQLRPLDLPGFETLVAEKLRPPHDRHGLVTLRERAMAERHLRELYRGRAPYELLQNADDVRARRAAFVLHRDGLAFLHDGEWFTVRDFENLALGWSNKDPNVCIGNKGLGFRSVLDVTPSPYVLRLGHPEYFGVKFSYALNRGHIDETLRLQPAMRDEVQSWGATRAICPVMSIPGFARRQSLSPTVSAILKRAASGDYGARFTTLFWFPASDPDIAPDVLRDLGPTPITLDGGRATLTAFLDDDVSELVLFLRHVLDVRLYEEQTLKATVTIPAEARNDVDIGSVITEVEGRRRQRNYFQVRASIPIPAQVRNQPDTSQTLRSMDEARVAVVLEIADGRPIADAQAQFHVYFPTEEPTGVGFVVHGDFYVKPDRTRLVKGTYNDWLFKEAASLAAGPFLTNLMARYRHRDVFESMRPVKSLGAGSAGQAFVEYFGRALSSRSEPFVPTTTELRRPVDVLLPRMVDESGVWESHVGDELARTREGRRFLLPSEDSRDSRAFLELAGVQELSAEAFLDLVESSAAEPKAPSWWYGCYEHMSAHSEIGRWAPERFVGRRIVPNIGGGVAVVPADSGLTVLVLPPRGRTDLPQPPPSFERLVEFVLPELADLLWAGDETVRSWVIGRFRVATYEVTDFLQRVVPAVAPQLFEVETALDKVELATLWRFVRGAIDAAARPISDESFWEVIGRLPMPIRLPGQGRINPANLAPAFLTYFPDEWLGADQALSGVDGLRRISPEFLSMLSPDAGAERPSWWQLLQHAGVSAAPKTLRYRRIVPGPLLLLTPKSPESTKGAPFQGRRQQDENRALLDLLRSEQLWPVLVADAPRCDTHPQQVGLAEVTLIDGLASTVDQALEEHKNGNERWIGRLHQLALDLTIDLSNPPEVVTACQQCRREGRAPGGVVSQLQRHHWVPTSFGPWTQGDSFLRLTGHRLVGLEPDLTELGDKLLPYTVAKTIDEYGHFMVLGIDQLDNAATASTAAVFRFLGAIGRALSSERAINDVLSIRSRWRLVRGAVQEAYRALNRHEGPLPSAEGLRLAVRTADGPRFLPAPWHYAEPGSVIARAFSDRLNIVDADRAYAVLFSKLGIVPLQAGQTVTEDLAHVEETQAADRLRTQIVESLAPFLLAVVVGRSEDPQHAELVTRRLRERFAVRTARSLRVALELVDGSARAEITVEPFYLQRSVEAQGSRTEATFVLYAVADPNADLFALDGDALGVALAPVFLSGPSEELSPLFPRVVARFQRVEGNAEEMASFLLEQLGISTEAQETAVELLRGEGISGPGQVPPAPTIVVGHGSGGAGALDAARDAALANLQQMSKKIQDQIAARLSHQGSANGGGGEVGGGGHSAGGAPPVTREQEARGQRGEEELKRRLQLPEGWGSFRLRADRRAEGCGYDFQCDTGGNEAQLEVKTFLAGGRVVVTLRELQEAYASRLTYYLVGLCDDGGPSGGWKTFILQDPIESLLRVGDFQLETKVEAPAEKLFEFK